MLHTKTYSLWGYIRHTWHEYINPIYEVGERDTRVCARSPRLALTNGGLRARLPQDPL